MQKFKTIREAMTMSPYAIGMAQAKKMYGYGKGPATDLPKKVIKKAHDIAKRVKANESFEDLVEAKTFETESGTAKVNDTHVHFDNSGYEQKFAHHEIHKMIAGKTVRGFKKDNEYSTGDTHVFTNNEEDHYLPTKAMKHIKESVDLTDKDEKGVTYKGMGTDVVNKKKKLNPSTPLTQKDRQVKDYMEEVEDLDEVSKKLLHSYINKAAFDVGSNAHAVASAGSSIPKIQKPLDQLNKRLRGIDKAAGKMAKEEVEDLDELSKKTLAAYAMSASSDAVKNQRKQSNYYRVGDDDDEAPGTQKLYTRMANKAGEKKVKRLSGIATALSKLAKEEVENIDELSKKTLGSYVNKVSRDMVNREVGINNALRDPSYPDNIIHKAVSKQSKRAAGMDKAISKLTKEAKEDVEEIDELSRNTMSSYASKASDASKYKGMSTSKVDKRYSGVAQASKKLDKMNQSASNMAKEAKEEMPTGIKIYHKNKDTGKEGYAIQFTVKNAQAHIKDLKKAGHTVTGKALMYGTKESPRKAMSEEKLDELKKSTYGDYINTASRRLRASASIRKDFERDADQDVNRAYKRGIDPDEKERHLKNYEVNKGLAADFAKDSEKRLAGISRATKKLTK